MPCTTEIRPNSKLGSGKGYPVDSRDTRVILQKSPVIRLAERMDGGYHDAPTVCQDV